MTVDLHQEPIKQKRKIWKLNNMDGWEDFNKEMKESEHRINTYNDWENEVITNLKKTVGQTTITIGKYRTRENEEVKKHRQVKREMKKHFEEACRLNDHNKKEKLTKYLQAQTDLRRAIHEQNKREVTQNMLKIIKEGGTKSSNFWKTRRKIMNTQATDRYELITEEDEKIEDPTESKQYIADFFEQLYQARPGEIEYEKWTNLITKRVKEISEEMITLPNEEPISSQEMRKAIKRMKRKKSNGPDLIPNEVFIEADNNTLNIHRRIMNKILQEGKIPTQWSQGEIIRIYKGKGKKGKCSNERGITLASNAGKLLERIINNRAETTVQMSDLQAGGKRGRATVDHIRIIKDLITTSKQRKGKPTVAFLDVTKAYDKAWLDAVMYVLHKQGVTNKLWNTLKQMNENLTARIKTIHGKTRPIIIKDSIRQGVYCRYYCMLP